MPNSNRQKGDYLERQTKAALIAHGWIVTRAAGSLGVADIVALRAGNTPLLISCKLDARIGPGERTALIEAARAGGARPIMAARSKRGLVDIYVVQIDAGGALIDQIKVPSRPGKEEPEELIEVPRDPDTEHAW